MSPVRQKAGHARQEREHEDVEIDAGLLEIPPGEHHGRGHEHCGQAGQPGAECPGLEVDAEDDVVMRAKAGEPVHDVAVRGPRHDDAEQDSHGRAGADRDRIEDSPPGAQDRAERGNQGRQQ